MVAKAVLDGYTKQAKSFNTLEIIADFGGQDKEREF